MSNAIMGRVTADRSHKTIVDQLQARIFDGTFGVDQTLPSERELSKVMGVSRTVVRDAIRILATRGLIEVRHGMPTVVSRSTKQALTNALIVALLRSNALIEDLVRLRVVIETGVAIAAARNASRASWSDIDSAFVRLENASRARDLRQTEEAHLEFHSCIIRLLGNQALEIFLDSLQELVLMTSIHPKLWDQEIWDLVWDIPSHRILMNAIKSGDEVATVAAVNRHYAYLEDARYAEFLGIRCSDVPDLRLRLLEQLR